jgi:hypothetical protein
MALSNAALHDFADFAARTVSLRTRGSCGSTCRRLPCKSSSGFLVRSFFERVYACCICARAPSKPYAPEFAPPQRMPDMVVDLPAAYQILKCFVGQPASPIAAEPGSGQKNVGHNYRRPWRSALCERILSVLATKNLPVVSSRLPKPCCARSRISRGGPGGPIAAPAARPRRPRSGAG